MIDLKPINQTRLFGLENHFNELVHLYSNENLPNKILLSGQKGLGKSTLAYHFVNFVLSKDEEYKYNIKNFTINSNNRSYKTLINKSNPNFFLIDVTSDKKKIDIDQIRELIFNLNKSSFNQKPRFVLIDNLEFLNINSINALLKVLEEPSKNVHFLLINNNKRILSTLLSRCIDFKISLSNEESFLIANKLLNKNLYDNINKDLINYYSTPGNIYNLILFGLENKIDLAKLNLKDLLIIIIKDKLYKKNHITKALVLDLIECFFNKINSSLHDNILNKYSYFIKKISDIRQFNLDDESLYMEFEDKVLHG